MGGLLRLIHHAPICLDLPMSEQTFTWEQIIEKILQTLHAHLISVFNAANHDPNPTNDLPSYKEADLLTRTLFASMTYRDLVSNGTLQNPLADATTRPSLAEWVSCGPDLIPLLVLPDLERFCSRAGLLCKLDARHPTCQKRINRGKKGRPIRYLQSAADRIVYVLFARSTGLGPDKIKGALKADIEWMQLPYCTNDRIFKYAVTKPLLVLLNANEVTWKTVLTGYIGIVGPHNNSAGASTNTFMKTVWKHAASALKEESSRLSPALKSDLPGFIRHLTASRSFKNPFGDPNYTLPPPTERHLRWRWAGFLARLLSSNEPITLEHVAELYQEISRGQAPETARKLQRKSGEYYGLALLRNAVFSSSTTPAHVLFRQWRAKDLFVLQQYLPAKVTQESYLADFLASTIARAKEIVAALRRVAIAKRGTEDQQDKALLESYYIRNYSIKSVPIACRKPAKKARRRPSKKRRTKLTNSHFIYRHLFSPQGGDITLLRQAASHLLWIMSNGGKHLWIRKCRSEDCSNFFFPFDEKQGRCDSCMV